MSNPNQVIAVRYENGVVYLKLADGRVIGNPLAWHPWLMQANDQQRATVEFYELSVYFPDLDDGLDVEEMIKGMPPRLAQAHQQVAE